MPFLKVVKNKAYFKRFQTKYRRRREGKTDYFARKRMIMQDKNKYLTPKYRLVVRLTNTQVICQVMSSNLNGDITIAAAYSSELKRRYGLAVPNLKNYASAYATGLLVARRALQKLGLDSMYEGNTEVTGEVVSTEEDDRTFFVSEVDDKRRPFRCVLDVGTRATTTGARLFGALKGATDGGLDVPHNEKRFPGYDSEEKSYDAGVHRGRIFGEHVAEYMRLFDEEKERKEAAPNQFDLYAAGGIGADDLEGHWAAVHAAIRADPKARERGTKSGFDKKYKNPAKRSIKQRKDRVRQKKEARLNKLLAAAE